MGHLLEHSVDQKPRPEREAQREKENAPNGKKRAAVRFSHSKKKAGDGEHEHNHRKVIAEFPQKDEICLRAHGESLASAIIEEARNREIELREERGQRHDAGENDDRQKGSPAKVPSAGFG